jgi:simple sugar transport system ATP-binding protein
VAQGPIENYTKKQLSELMIGREIDAERYRTGTPGEAELLKLDGLSSPDFRNINLTLRKGEVLGITGLADSGRNELAMAITGVDPASNGAITLEGRKINVKSPAEAIELGIGYVPEDRLAEGLFLDKSIFENEVALILTRLSNSLGVINQKKGREIAASLMEQMRLNTKNLDLPVGALSGGNQQRVLIGRWLSIGPKLLVLHGPTVGVDVGSKDTIYRAIQTLAEAGMGLIIVSDDLPELLQNADRILVMNAGSIVKEFDAAEATEDQLYQAMMSSQKELPQ